MKNLDLLQLSVNNLKTPLNNVKILDQTPSHIYYIENDKLYKITRNLYENYKETEGKAELIKVIANSENVVAIKFIEFENKICVIHPGTIEIIDSCGTKETVIVDMPDEDVIQTIEWSHGDETVATVMGNGNVATFTLDYENGKVHMRSDSSLESDIPDTVYVGWGSEQTQFRGSEGKSAKKRGEDLALLPPVIDRKPLISWRGNGEMFAVNYWKNDRRQIMVYENPCKALYRSELYPGLQSPLAWRPSGNMIVATATSTTNQEIVTFEKNGQEKFKFDPGFGQQVSIVEMKWSPCATILAIRCRHDDGSESIRLMTSSNYKWYEKQTIEFDRHHENRLLDFHWLDASTTFALSVITAKQIFYYKFKSVICRKNDSSAICAVVNGNRLQITNFHEKIIPPPLYSSVVTVKSTVNQVAFCQNSEMVAILDSQNNLSIHNLEDNGVVANFNLDEKVPDFEVGMPLRHHHLQYPEKDFVCFVSESNGDRVLYSLNILTGELSFIDSTDNDVTFLTVMPESRVEFVSAECDAIELVSSKIGKFRLNSRNSLFFDDTVLAEDVRSFLVTDSYVIYVTKANLLFCASLGVLDRKFVRNVEQGSIIVTNIPETSRIILQMPRGNIETISIRSVAMDMLDTILNRGDWSKALYLMRLEKLNVNLIYELDRDRFLSQIPNFIEAATTLNELNSICLELKDGENVKQLFDAILNYFDSSVDYAPYMSTIMIITLNHYDLKTALGYIQDLLRRCQDDSSLTKFLTDAVNTLKAYGVDYKLFEEALNLYDLDLAKFFANCCQIDPRVWQPQLSKLESLTELERRFEINMAAKNYQMAVAYLLRLPDVTSNDICQFIDCYKVSREAYKSLPNSKSRHFLTVSKCFGQFLSAKGRHLESGAVFKRAGALDLALDEFKMALKLTQVLNLLDMLNVDSLKRKQILIELADGLYKDRQFGKAAFVYEEYCQNYDMAVKILLEGGKFEKASHLAQKYQRNDIFVSDIVPALEKHFNYLTVKVTELQRTFVEYKRRLGEVRQLKRQKLTDDDGMDDRHSDLFSESGSTISTRSTKSSLRSKSSTASSKNRRKEARKKQDLRQGGVYEDIALIRALHTLIAESHSLTADIEQCCIVTLQETVIPYSDIERLYESHVRYLRVIKGGVEEIWPSHFYSYNTTGNNGDKCDNLEQLADLDNLEHLDLEFRTPPLGINYNWHLDLFKDISFK